MTAALPGPSCRPSRAKERQRSAAAAHFDRAAAQGLAAPELATLATPLCHTKSLPERGQ